MRSESINLLGLYLSLLDETEVLEKIKMGFETRQVKMRYITTPNPEIALQAFKDKELLRAINTSAISLTDGFGLFLMARLLGKKVRRVTGSDFMHRMMELALEKNYSIGLLGGREGVVQKAKTRLLEQYPNLKIVYADSGPRELDFDYHDPLYLNRLKKARPQILFVGFGAPKQEKWLYYNQYELPEVRWAMGIGGGLDFIAREVKRAPCWMRKLGLEWLYRLIQQPFRARRVFRAVVIFPCFFCFIFFKNIIKRGCKDVL